MNRIATVALTGLLALGAAATVARGETNPDSSTSVPGGTGNNLPSELLTSKVAIAALADIAMIGLSVEQLRLCIGPTSIRDDSSVSTVPELIAEDVVGYFEGRNSIFGRILYALERTDKTALTAKLDKLSGESMAGKSPTGFVGISCTSEAETDANEDLGLRANALVHTLVRSHQTAFCGYSPERQASARKALENERRKVLKCGAGVLHVVRKGWVYTGDVELGREFRENPIKAEVRFLGNMAVVVGRVSEITHPPRQGFLVPISPRYPAEPRTISCELRKRARREAAQLQRNELAIFSGKLQQDERRQLWLRSCDVEYLFNEPGNLVARSTERCFMDAFDPMHARLAGTADDLAVYRARVIRETAASRIDCKNPIVFMSVLCELGSVMGSPRWVLKESCDRREFRDIRNEMLEGAENGDEKTRLELGQAINAPQREQSLLYKEAVRSGRIHADQDP